LGKHCFSVRNKGHHLPLPVPWPWLVPIDAALPIATAQKLLIGTFFYRASWLWSSRHRIRRPASAAAQASP
jgi:hypothetical protein